MRHTAASVTTGIQRRKSFGGYKRRNTIENHQNTPAKLAEQLRCAALDMIISHAYRYLFIEIPHTGTTAISRELIEQYDGLPTLYKHAHYHEFLRSATNKEKTYFVFGGLQNPFDEAVSMYFKAKTNHKGH